ncbi:hypothetical protein [Photobacterium aquimaris]|nr:hypothetical protein [Photobacterium aquimaris]
MALPLNDCVACTVKRAAVLVLLNAWSFANMWAEAYQMGLLSRLARQCL